MRGVQVKETGHATMEDRRLAAWNLWEKITVDEDWQDSVSEKDAELVDSIEGLLDVGWDISAKQYFWLKDIYDRLVDRGVI